MPHCNYLHSMRMDNCTCKVPFTWHATSTMTCSNIGRTCTCRIKWLQHFRHYRDKKGELYGTKLRTYRVGKQSCVYKGIVI